MGEVFGDGAHLDGQNAFGDHLARAATDEADAEDAARYGVGDDLCAALRLTEDQRATAGRPVNEPVRTLISFLSASVWVRPHRRFRDR